MTCQAYSGLDVVEMVSDCLAGHSPRTAATLTRVIHTSRRDCTLPRSIANHDGAPGDIIRQVVRFASHFLVNRLTGRVELTRNRYLCQLLTVVTKDLAASADDAHVDPGIPAIRYDASRACHCRLHWIVLEPYTHTVCNLHPCRLLEASAKYIEQFTVELPAIDAALAVNAFVDMYLLWQRDAMLRDQVGCPYDTTVEQLARGPVHGVNESYAARVASVAEDPAVVACAHDDYDTWRRAVHHVAKEAHDVGIDFFVDLAGASHRPLTEEGRRFNQSIGTSLIDGRAFVNQHIDKMSAQDGRTAAASPTSVCCLCDDAAELEESPDDFLMPDVELAGDAADEKPVDDRECAPPSPRTDPAFVDRKVRGNSRSSEMRYCGRRSIRNKTIGAHQVDYYEGEGRPVFNEYLARCMRESMRGQPGVNIY